MPRRSFHVGAACCLPGETRSLIVWYRSMSGVSASFWHVAGTGLVSAAP